MKILVSGARGFVGSALTQALHQRGDDVVALTRRPISDSDVAWDPQQGTIESVAGFDAVVHLAGESIAEGRWTPAKKARIRDSRVKGTQLLSSALSGLADDQRPHTLLSASAIGFYGDRGDEQLTEASVVGDLFLSEVCQAWETASQPAGDAGIRVVNARLGVILHPAGGALSKMLLPFKMGAGGIVGNGKQYWSWISLDDVVGALVHCLDSSDIRGPVNIVAPNPVTNHTFTKALGRVLRRPTIFPMPAFAARLALGEMADELLLASAKVIPETLQSSGYAFQHAEVEAALGHLLK